MAPRFGGFEKLFTITIIVALSASWHCFSHFNSFQFKGFFQFDSPLLYIYSMLSEECQWGLCRTPKNRKSEPPFSHSFFGFRPRVEIKKKYITEKSFKNAFESILKHFQFSLQIQWFYEALTPLPILVTAALLCVIWILVHVFSFKLLFILVTDIGTFLWKSLK